MKKSIIYLAVVIAAFSQCSQPAVEQEVVAFPGAEGYGRHTLGGRGGDVYIVTNLNDSGEGSLRYGIENAEGPRTIVFEVSGTILLKDHLIISKPYLTIAGQTAPGDGIAIRDYGLKIKDTHDVIMRYIRVRLGDQNKPRPAGFDAIETNDISDIIFDHISASWGIDGTHDLRGQRFTLQWSIYGEALNNSLHKKGSHAMLGSMRDNTDNITLHHNLMHSSRNRHPSLGGGSKTKAETIIDFRNNVLFNWTGCTNLGSCQLNVINNYYKPGESSDTSMKPMAVKSNHGVGNPRGYVFGNVFPWNQTWTADNFLAVDYTRHEGDSYIGTTREEWALPGELVFGDDKPETQSAEEAFELVLKNAGASLHRDAADERVVAGVIAGSG
ncbi:MAG: pectate lyase, partial [Bacteroidales bacterium]|nr:pectate lyase [Bacteroidales bacterium]